MIYPLQNRKRIIILCLKRKTSPLELSRSVNRDPMLLVSSLILGNKEDVFELSHFFFFFPFFFSFFFNVVLNLIFLMVLHNLQNPFLGVLRVFFGELE